jgi:hypothetical protein
MEADQIDEMVAGYIKCALFTADEDLIPPKSGQFDDSPYRPDVSDEMRAEARAVCEAFYKANAADLTTYDADDAGIDLWFDRNGHGVGFWEADHCTEEEGERLSNAARKLGARSIYRDDGGLFQFDLG